MDGLNYFDPEDNVRSLWCAVFLDELLTKMDNDENLEDNEWIYAFNLFFLGVQKKEENALSISASIVNHYEKLKKKADAKRKIKRLAELSGCKYKKFYIQLGKEIFNFNPSNSRFVMMVKDGVENNN